jgi:hypothetical protein
MTERETELLHLMRMAAIPGFADHLEWKLTRLEKLAGFAGITAELNKRMNDAQSCKD